MVLDQSNGANPAARHSYGTLIVIPPGGATQTVVLYKSVVRLGQATDNDIVLPDPSTQPYHAQLFCRHTSFELLALSDMGDTSIDGEQLPAYTPYLLADNSVVQIGRTRIFVYPPEGDPAPELPLTLDAPASNPQAPASDVGSYGLVVALGPDSQRRIPINRLVLWIGSAPDNDIVLPAIAPYYAQLVSTPQGYDLITLASEQRTAVESVVEIADWRLMIYSAAEAPQIEPAESAEASADPAELQLPVVAASLAEPPAESPPSPGDLSATPVIIELPHAEAPAQSGSAPEQPVSEMQIPPELERSYGTAIVRYPDGQTQHISLGKPTIRLGRASDNDLVIDYSVVSEHHAQIFCTGEIFNILDLNSASGTKLDNRRLSPYAIQALSPDSVVQIGELALFLYPPNATIPTVLPTPRPEPADLATTLRLGPAEPTAPARITRLKLTPTISTLEAGETTTLTISFVNQSLVLERVSLAVSGLPAAWVDISEQEIPVFPSAKGEIKIKLTPPREASSHAGSYPFSVQVWSDHDPSQVRSTPATLLIRPFTQFQIALFPRHQSGRHEGLYQVELTNQGNTDQSFDLHCFDELNAFDPSFNSRTVWVKSGTTYQLSVCLRIKRFIWWFGKRQGYHFVISARAADNQVEQARGIFIHVPPISRGTKYPPKPTKTLPAPQPAPTTDLALRPAAPLARQQPPAGDAAPAAPAPRPRRQPENLPVTGATRRLATVPASDEDSSDVYQPAHITMTMPNLITEAGAAATTTLSVINRSSIVDRLSFKVAGLPPAWITIVPESIPLLPNAQAEAQLIINPPRNFRSLAETTRFRLIAQSEKRPDQQVFALGALTIKPFIEFKQEIFPKEQKVRREARYNLQITNKGNQEQAFLVQGSNDEDLLDFATDVAELVVPPGETRKTQLRARVRDRQFIGTSRMHPFMVSVTPSGSPDMVQQSTARLTDRPRIPQWLVQVVLLPLVLLIIALFMLWGRSGIVGFVNELRGKGSTPSAAVVTTAGGPTAALTGTTVLNPPPTLIVQTPITNEIRWTQADSPKVLRVNYTVPAGTLLTIDPGVEVQLASRVRLEVAGALTADGTASQPVEFRTADGGDWDGIYVVDGGVGYILNSQIEDAGARNSSLVAQNATLIVRDSTLSNNAGGIYSSNSYVELQRLSITNNVFEQNPALALRVGAQGSVVIDAVSIENNTFSGNAAIAHLVLEGQQATLDVQNAVFNDQARLSMLIEASADFKATLRCNTFANTTVGLGIAFASALPREAGRDIRISDNAFSGNGQSGLQSSALLNAANNWWGDASGPTDARRNPGGRGVRVSDAVTFTPWLTAEQACTRSP